MDGTVEETNHRRPLRAAVLAGLATASLAPLALGSCASTGVAASARSATSTLDFRRGTERVDIDLDAGDVTVGPGAADHVGMVRTLHWRTEQPTYTEVYDGTTLRITARCPRHDPCSVDYALTVPPSVSLRVHTAAGDLDINGVDGALELDVDSGAVHLTRTSGAVRVDGRANDIRGTALHSSTVQVQTVSGDVRLEFATSPTTVEATTSSGDIGITVPRPSGGGYRVRASTAAGTRTVDVLDDPSAPRSLKAVTDSGDVAIGYH